MAAHMLDASNAFVRSDLDDVIIFGKEVKEIDAVKRNLK